MDRKPWESTYPKGVSEMDKIITYYLLDTELVFKDRDNQCKGIWMDRFYTFGIEQYKGLITCPRYTLINHKFSKILHSIEKHVKANPVCKLHWRGALYQLIREHNL